MTKKKVSPYKEDVAKVLKAFADSNIYYSLEGEYMRGYYDSIEVDVEAILLTMYEAGFRVVKARKK